MEILKNFGFEWTLFIAQIVNFLIIFFVLKKFLYAPLLKTIEDRKQKIADGIRNSEEAAIILHQARENEEEILRKAQTEAKNLIEEAKKEHLTIINQAEESAKIRIDKMLMDAREQIVLETKQAQKNISTHVTSLAVQFLQQATKGLFNNDDQNLLMKNAIKKLKKTTD